MTVELRPKGECNMTIKTVDPIHRIINRDQKRLDNIGSSKSIRDFLEARKVLRDKRVFNHSILINFWAQEKNHGCRFRCSYCNWPAHELMQRSQIPTNDELDEFTKDFMGYKIYLSGGGDPLYNYSENGHEIERIVNHLNNRGFLVNVITRELDTAVQIQDIINGFNFSVDSRDKNVLEACKKITKASKRISVVWNEERSPEFYFNLFKYYSPYVDEIYIREDLNKYNFQTSVESFVDLAETMWKGIPFEERMGKLIFFPAKICLANYYLVDGKASTGIEVL